MEELDDEEYERSKFDGSESKLRWIWGAGLSLGKKMVVTGVVISTAPFVLPPLVALSAIGFAFSLPAGFVLATYACTDKLMNTLLPMPSPPYLEPMMPSDDEEYLVEKAYEEKEFEEDTRKMIELVEGDGDVNGKNYEIPTHEDYVLDNWMRVTAIVAEDVGDEQNLDSNVIPIILEGIREAENEISLIEREGVLTPKDSLLAFVVEAEVGEENEDIVEQVTEVLAFVPQTDMQEKNWNKGKFTAIDENELRNETTGVLEQRKEGRDSPPKRGHRENQRNGGFPIKDVSQETGDKILFVIPEEVKSVSIEETEDLDKTVGERRGKGIESRVIIEQPEVVIERKIVVNVKTSGDHTAADGYKGTGLEEKIGSLVLPDVNEREKADEGGFDDATEVPDSSSDSLSKRPQGENLASDSGIDASTDYLEVRIKSISISEQTEIGLDQEVTSRFDKVLINEEKIWEQINAMRTIIGCKTAPHTSCVEELEVLYEFTGVDLPVSSKDGTDLADVNEKLHFLRSIVGVK